MFDAEKNKIAELLSLASEFNANDILVNLSDLSMLKYTNGLEIPWNEVQSIVRKSQNLIKESGVNPLCLAKGSIAWKRNGVDICSPLLLIPIHFQQDKVRSVLKLELDYDLQILNPFVVKHLKQEFDIEIIESNDLDEVISFLRGTGFQQVDSHFSALGNFHYHRYEILKELDELSKFDSFNEAFSEVLIGTKTELEKQEFTSMRLLAADIDHEVVFHDFKTHNLVVQGPPGTGKSQLLTNFIGKFIHSKQSLLVVSEKRSALEVIVQKMQQFDLNHLCYIASPELTSRDLIQSLKRTWNILEAFEIKQISVVSNRKELVDNLQFTLDLIHQERLIGNISWLRFQELKQTRTLESYTYFSSLPSLDLLENNLELIQRIYNQGINKSVGAIKFHVFSNAHLDGLNDAIQQWKASIASFKAFYAEEITLLSFDNYRRKLGVYALFENEITKQHIQILVPNSKEQKKFVKHFVNYEKLQVELENAKKYVVDWKKLPSKLEIESLEKSLVLNSFWSKRKVVKRWNELSNLSIEFASRSLENLKGLYLVEEELSKTEGIFTDLGIVDVKQNVAILYQSIPLFTEEKWAIYRELESKDNSFSDYATPIIGTISSVKTFLNLETDQNIEEIIHSISTQFGAIVSIKTAIQKLDQATLTVLAKCETFDEFMNSVLGSHFSHFKDQYPTMSDFQPTLILEKIEGILNSEITESDILARQITNSQYLDFVKFNELLSTPAAKLSTEEKTLKSRLRKGKSILVKEFSKTKSHPSLRELMSSDAKEWIQLLKPVWLSNPAQLAKCFPLEQELFDVCIFDEASQIPLQNGLGALFRSKRLIIAGDQQQMNPTTYFKSGSENQMSLLHQANYNLKQGQLKHHYRSQHAELIAFSNKYFYNNELKVFPSFPPNENCLRVHFCETGRFIDRTNLEEAKQVSLLIREAIKSKKTLGIVAFSQEQVACIWKVMDSKCRFELETLIEENKAFLKSLEKVQGDECEHLIISMAYGKNESNDFEMRFGPLNTASGRNRLNVLFSRASQEIDFVCSVRAADFKLSENESVNLLRSWFQFIEKQKDFELEFPFSPKPKINENELLVEILRNNVTKAQELVTQFSVLQNRGWKLRFV